MPDFSFETTYAAQLGLGTHEICGVDEAGRGPWAGPVVAAAVILDNSRLLRGIDDSKKLTEMRREALYDLIIESALSFAIHSVEAAEIDQINILNATHLAMSKAVEGLQRPPRLALIDGNRAPKLLCETRTLVKGDSLSLTIAAASILAKVTRDRLMLKAASQYPHYGFERHKGYGVPTHAAALQKYGPCPLHRMSFKPVKASLSRP
jgi:ribonuclease HII